VATGSELERAASPQPAARATAEKANTERRARLGEWGMAHHGFVTGDFPPPIMTQRRPHDPQQRGVRAMHNANANNGDAAVFIEDTP
jgi:hypothetical protein